MLDSLRNEVPRLLVLAGPMVVAQLLQVSMGFVDTIMVGRLGAESLAAVALGGAVYYPLFLVSAGILSAVSALVSQSHGAGHADPIGRTVRQGFWLGTMLSIPAIVLMWHVEPALLEFGLEPKVASLTQDYLETISPALLPALWYTALRHFVEALGRPKSVMVITLFGAIANVGGNYVLMYGKLGFPEMGVAGTGLSTTIVSWILFGSLVVFVQRHPSLRTYGVFSRLGKPDTTTFRRLFRLGWPIGIMFGVETGLFAVAAFMMGRLGTTEVAAHQIALQCAAFTFMVPLGIAFATTVRVGFEIGAGNPHGARIAGLTGIAVSALFMGITAVLFFTFPRAIIGLYLDLSDPANSPVVHLAVMLLGLAAVFQVFDGVQVTASGALRGIADTRVPMIVAVASYWGVGFTGAYFFAFKLELGPSGIWWGLVIGLAAAAVLLLGRFLVLSLEPERLIPVNPATQPHSPTTMETS
ncbi:MAG TPA: MATE family efflux transporter [Rhodothermia bacterium]